jgi:hypothetical protein
MNTRKKFYLVTQIRSKLREKGRKKEVRKEKQEKQSGRV